MDDSILSTCIPGVLRELPALIFRNWVKNYSGKLFRKIQEFGEQTRKIIEICRVFTVFTHTHTHTHKKRSIGNFYQKELLGWFSENFKMCPSHNVLNWYTSNRLQFDIYGDSMGLNTNVNVNSLIF